MESALAKAPHANHKRWLSELATRVIGRGSCRDHSILTLDDLARVEDGEVAVEGTDGLYVSPPQQLRAQLDLNQVEGCCLQRDLVWSRDDLLAEAVAALGDDTLSASLMKHLRKAIAQPVSIQNFPLSFPSLREHTRNQT